MKKLKREAEAMVRMTVRVSEGLAERTKIRAIQDKISFQDLVGEALEAYLKTPRRKEGAR
jgi:predicted DNA binding CopG/RHH family protein